VGVPNDTIALSAGRLGQYLDVNSPAVVVLTNANQIDRLLPSDGNRYIIDFFAPKLLERVYEQGSEEPYPVEELRTLRDRKLRGIARADGFIVNGRKKLPYFLAWILQTDRDIRTVPFEQVGMCLPSSFSDSNRPDNDGDAPTRFVLAGYLQGWSVPGAWLQALVPHLEQGRCTLDAMLPEHWGGLSGFDNSELIRLVDEHAIRVHGPRPLGEFRQFLHQADVVLDLFARTLERELAVVTRTIVALCCGKPVVHPPFTEVAPLIEEFDAGWLVEPSDEAQLADVLEEIVSDGSAVQRKSHGARRLWAEHLDPVVAVEGLVRVIEQVTASSAHSPLDAGAEWMS
jgi:hypothetical protein